MRRSADSIKKSADLWRVASGKKDSNKLNVVTFIQTILSQQIPGGLLIRFMRRGGQDVQAKVKFDPLVLEIDERIWRQAQSPNVSGYRLARFILAHEIGHIVLHRDQPKAFSLSDGRGNFYDQEESAEWQANKFARYFLLSKDDIEGATCAEDISSRCEVPLELAEEVWAESAEINGHFCEGCGGCARIRVGRTLCAACEAQDFLKRIRR